MVASRIDALLKLSVIAGVLARRDDPGTCPGEGWPPAPSIVSWIVDKAGYSAAPILSDMRLSPRACKV
jgi:hypothetical protein